MKFQIQFQQDFDFVECVNAHGWKTLAPFSWDIDTRTLSRVELFAGYEPVLLSITSSSSALIVEVAGVAPMAETAQRVSHMLQLDVPMDRFHNYCLVTPNLLHIPTAKQGRMLRSPTVFEDVVKVIATTNTTWAQTKAMVGRIVDNFGTPFPADETKRAFPVPEQITNRTPVQFGELARMGYRSDAVHKIATDIVEGRLDLESLNNPGIPSDELYKFLLTLPGIGPYAASCLMIYLGRYDRVNVDSWARTLVGKELGRKVTDKEVHAFFEPYGEWKALVYQFYRWRDGSAEERTLAVDPVTIPVNP